ncbi:hypothetical protein HDV01_000844 [Terramyces sp. JEL0728]|nr:hypothetical protein HDV01_000844 [Terramyces sp. JEL0728]
MKITLQHTETLLLKELPLVCKYYQDDVYVSTEKGNILKRTRDSYQTIPLHSNLIHDFIIKDNTIYTCSQDKTVCIYDLNSSTKQYLTYNGPVKSIIKDENQIITCCKDKTITIQDTRSKNKKTLSDNSTSIQFKYNLYSMGQEGIIKLWDYRNYKPVELNVYDNTRKYGFISSCVNENIYCLSMDNQIYEISLDLQLKKIHEHPELLVGFFNKIDVSFCGEYLACGSKSNDIILFQQVLKGHLNEISGLCWSDYDYKLASVSDDYQLKEWIFKTSRKYIDPVLGAKYLDLLHGRFIDSTTAVSKGDLQPNTPNDAGLPPKLPDPTLDALPGQTPSGLPDRKQTPVGDKKAVHNALIDARSKLSSSTVKKRYPESMALSADKGDKKEMETQDKENLTGKATRKEKRKRKQSSILKYFNKNSNG